MGLYNAGRMNVCLYGVAFKLDLREGIKPSPTHIVARFFRGGQAYLPSILNLVLVTMDFINECIESPATEHSFVFHFDGQNIFLSLIMTQQTMSCQVKSFSLSLQSKAAAEK